MFIEFLLLKFYFPANFSKSLWQIYLMFVDRELARHITQKDHNEVSMDIIDSFAKAKTLQSGYQYDALVRLCMECR